MFDISGRFLTVFYLNRMVLKESVFQLFLTPLPQIHAYLQVFSEHLTQI